MVLENIYSFKSEERSLLMHFRVNEFLNSMFKIINFSNDQILLKRKEQNSKFDLPMLI